MNTGRKYLILGMLSGFILSMVLCVISLGLGTVIYLSQTKTPTPTFTPTSTSTPTVTPTPTKPSYCTINITLSSPLGIFNAYIVARGSLSGEFCYSTIKEPIVSSSDVIVTQRLIEKIPDIKSYCVIRPNDNLSLEVLSDTDLVGGKICDGIKSYIP